MNSDPDAFRAAAALLTLALGAGAIAWMLVRSLGLSRIEDEIDRGLAAYHEVDEIYRALARCLSATFANRVVVIRVENGGGTPAPDRALYSSVAFEVHDYSLPGLRDEWHRVPVDRFHSLMISTLVESGSISLDPEEMPDGRVRDTYFAHSLARGRAMKIGGTRTAFFYVAAHFTESIEDSVRASKPTLESLDPEAFRLEVERCRSVENHALATAALAIAAAIDRYEVTRSVIDPDRAARAQPVPVGAGDQD